MPGGTEKIAGLRFGRGGRSVPRWHYEQSMVIVYANALANAALLFASNRKAKRQVKVFLYDNTESVNWKTW